MGPTVKLLASLAGLVLSMDESLPAEVVIRTDSAVYQQVNPELLRSRNSEAGLEDYSNYTGHWLLDEPLLHARRNHDCIIYDGKLINLAGRFASTVETMDLQTGTQVLMSRNSSLLSMNHPTIALVDRLPGERTGKDIWITCGFIGHEVNKEVSMTHVTIVDADTLRPRLGPPLDRPRGACGTLPLHLDGPEKPALVCVFGGSDGTHDKGEMLDLVSCYDRVKKAWRKLPSLPVAGDHLNTVLMEGGACVEEGGEPSPKRVLALHIRPNNYGMSLREVFALDLNPDGGVMGDWYTFTTIPDRETRDAAGVVLSEDSSKLISLGGINHGMEIPDEEGLDRSGNPQQQVKLLDLCKRRWNEDFRMLFTPRFAIQACKSGDAIFACGGTFTRKFLINADRWMVEHPLHRMDRNTNLKGCEVFSEQALIRELPVP
ncbi:unnamed protein product [Discosporangium mesarthrocarpum]